MLKKPGFPKKFLLCLRLNDYLVYIKTQKFLKVLAENLTLSGLVNWVIRSKLRVSQDIIGEGHSNMRGSLFTKLDSQN